MLVKNALMGCFVVVLLAACTQTRVERIAVDETRDLSGRWNDTDSRLVSNEMVQDLLERPWLPNHVRNTGKPPAVIVGQVRNLSHEHVNVRTFVNDVERELINSGRVDFVASANERTQIRDERADQDLNASEETRKAMGRELGADYMLLGTINTIVDVEGRNQVTFYQVDLKLVSLVDNRTAWVGQKKIKKLIEGRSVRY